MEQRNSTRLSSFGRRGFGSDNALTSQGNSHLSARTWTTGIYDKDVQIQADVYLNSQSPVQIFAAGRISASADPTYYAVSVIRGTEVNLLRVVNGQTTTLATVASIDWLSNEWLRVNFTVRGNQLTVQVFRTDTAQYLGADDEWHAAPTLAISMADKAITHAGRVGLDRPSGIAGQVSFDNFSVNTTAITHVPTTLIEQNFNNNLYRGLPAGWWSYTNTAGHMFQVSGASTDSDTSGIIKVNGSSGLVARTWANTPLPADVEVSASLDLNSLVPAQVFARGQNLDTDSPDYYAVSLTRGATIQLVRVVNGATTVLGSLTTNAWLTQQWVQASLSVSGSMLRVQIYRADIGQYLRSDGQWQVAPTWAIQKTDSAILGPGSAGIGRASGYAGPVAFDNFYVVSNPAPTKAGPGPTQLYNFNSTAIGSVPNGWSSWTKTGVGRFQAVGPSMLSNSNGLASNGGSEVAARAWFDGQSYSDLQISGLVYIDSLAPTQLFVRGHNLASNSPSYYAVSVTRGLNVQLLKVIDGRTTVLATLNTKSYLTNLWFTVGLQAVANTLEVVINRQDTGQFLGADGTWRTNQSVALIAADGALRSGAVGVGRPALYSGRVLFQSLALVDLRNDSPPSPPDGSGNTGIPTSTGSSGGDLSGGGVQHYPYIRVAELAYYGTPLGDNELSLLKNGVDLVVANPGYLSELEAAAPNSTKLIYSNVSNIYLSLLTDWDAYADRNGIDRESAFYHVTRATPFSGASSSSIPVNWFWSVQRGSNADGWTNFTGNASNKSARDFAFGSAGQSLAIGYPEKFNQINLTFSQTARYGWSGVVEYATSVDAHGSPTGWKTLKEINDTTNGFRRNGTINFDPPADWQASSIGGSQTLFYVRVRTLHDGTAPVASTVLAADYVNARGRNSGVIPVFDYAADKNHDGYLNAAEYAVAVRAGDYARFAYQSRLFYPTYGQMRFATNPASVGFQHWAADFSARYLNAYPQADGMFVDNSVGKLAVSAGGIKESLSGYSANYGALLAAIDKKIAPRWILANTAGGGVSTNPIIANGVSYLEEFALRPLASNTTQFEDAAALVKTRLTLGHGKGYGVLDTFPQGGAPNDARTQIAELAEYYLVADPKHTFIMFNGGYEPATAWSRHWTNAVNYNVGQPQGSWSILASGADPANHHLTYKVYERKYQNALVLYKPLSYALKYGSGTLADNTATTQYLHGQYRQLHADGTLGAVITKLSLRNGEGAILIKA